MDGWGIAEPGPGNAVELAQTPNVDRWMAEYPYTTLAASGYDVGLPDGQIGNSEVGHLNIGAGFVVDQELTRLAKAIDDGSFFDNEALQGAVQHALDNNSNLHLMGLFGPGGVHAHQNHLHALIELAARHGLDRVFLHLFTDGRDVPPRSALGFLDTLEAEIARIGVGQIAVVSGRYYAMDRDQRWERTGKAYDAMVLGRGRTAASAREAIQTSYDAQISDEFIVPTVIMRDGAPVALVGDNDAAIFFNFRPDRGRQLTRAFVEPELNAAIRAHYEKQAAEGQALPDTIWQRPRQLNNLHFVTLTEYQAGLPVIVAFPARDVKQPLADVIASAGLTQFHIAETEKYPHVTFFFNGGREKPFEREDRTLVPSPKVATYDLQPEMSATGVTQKLLEAIRGRKYDFIIVNYANPDMVGHTGDLEAAITACETVDAGLGQVVPAVLEQGGALLIIADHGNAEVMIDPQTGGPHTAHTTNPVPAILAAAPQLGLDRQHISLREGGRLADVAPTLLEIMGVAPSADMTGKSLIVRKG